MVIFQGPNPKGLLDEGQLVDTALCTPRSHISSPFQGSSKSVYASLLRVFHCVVQSSMFQYINWYILVYNTSTLVQSMTQY